MAKDTFWFKHDYHARSDKEIMRLRMKMGMKGVGLYWCIIEMLYEEDGYLLRSEYERIAFELQSNYEDVLAVIENFNLFRKEGEKFWSESLIKRLNEKKEKSIKTRESVNKRWGNTNVLQTKNEGNTIRGEEKREEYIKEGKKEKNETETPLPQKKNRFNTKPVVSDFNGLPECKLPSAVEAHTLSFGVGITEADVHRFWNVFKSEALTGENFYSSEEKVYTHFLRWIKKQSLMKYKKEQVANIPISTEKSLDKYKKVKSNV